MPNIQKQQLKSEPINFRLLAIASSQSISQLVWHINKELNLSLIHNKELEGQLSFPAFTDRHSLQGCAATLIGNRIGGRFLLPQLHNIDFIIELTGSLDESVYADIQKKLKLIPGTLVVVAIPPQKVKRKEPFSPE